MSLWSGRKVIICVGTGGVGKTTVSAAIGVAAAAAGKRTLVMTIDPARRLANALGVEDFGNVEHVISPAQLAPYGVTLKAPLAAMMPDVKSTFDELIARTAPSAAQRQAILGNRIYQQFSRTLAGSLDYAAVEKLYEVYSNEKHDLIVLDTPPSQSVGDFLTAPARLTSFLEHETVQWLLKPYLMAGRFSSRLFNLGTSLIFATLGKLAGAETLRAIAEFVVGFQGMYDDFRERSARVRSLLLSEEVAFVLVGTARGPSQASMLRFREELWRHGMKSRAVVLNRVRPSPYAPGGVEATRERIAALVDDEAGRAALQGALTEEETLALEDETARRFLIDKLAPAPVITLPELPLDAHDLESLARLHRHFLG